MVSPQRGQALPAVSLEASCVLAVLSKQVRFRVSSTLPVDIVHGLLYLIEQIFFLFVR